jgi:hypothetical protein
MPRPGPTAPGAHVARAAHSLPAHPGRGRPRLPDHHDLCRRARRCARRPTWPRCGRTDHRRVYDPRNVPASHKQGLTIGMAMTEKQGGSDVRANTTRAYAGGRRSGARAGLRAGGPQVLRLGADVRCLPRAGAGTAGLSCFPAAALAAGRHARTRCRCCASSARWAMSPTPPARPSCAARWPGWSAKRVAACAPSSRWWR